MTELAPVLNSGREAATPGGGVEEVFASLQSSESGIDDGGEAGPSAAPRANRGSHSSFGSDDGLLLGGAGPRVGRAGVSLCQKNPAPNVTCSLLPFFIFLFLAPTINDLTILTFIPSTVAGSDAGDAADGGEQPRAKNALERWVENNLDGWTQVGGGVAGMRRPTHTHTPTRWRASGRAIYHALLTPTADLPLCTRTLAGVALLQHRGGHLLALLRHHALSGWHSVLLAG